MQDTVVINPAYRDLSDFIHTISAHFHEGQLVYKSRNEVRMFTVHDIPVNVKRYCIPIIFNQVIYSLFRKPKAERAYRNASILTQAGIQTADPIAYILRKKYILLRESYFFSIHLTDMETIRERGKLPTAGQEDFFIALARFTAKLHESGIYPKDYSPGNILYRKEQNRFVFALIDINRMAFVPVSIERGCRNFARLWARTSAFVLMAREYASCRHADTDLCIRKVLACRTAFWNRYKRKRTLDFRYDD